MPVIRFAVYGRPATAGSKRGIVVNKKDGSQFVAMKDDSAERGTSWRGAVATAAAEAMAGRPLLRGPLSLGLCFQIARPKGHFGTGRNAGKVKPTARTHPDVKPDLSKMTRAVEDALKGVVWQDDKDVCRFHELSKTYGEPEGVIVSIYEIQPAEAA